MRGLNERSTVDLDVMMEVYKGSEPLDVELVTSTLRKDGRDVMADIVEAMGDYISELKIKLEKAVKNRQPRQHRHKK